MAKFQKMFSIETKKFIWLRDEYLFFYNRLKILLNAPALANY